MIRPSKMRYTVAACLALGVGPAQAAAWHAMDWIDGWYETSTPAMQRALGVDQATVNCKDLSIRTTPAACVSWIIANAVPGITAYVPYMNANPATFASNALQFSAVSLGTPIPEVDLDDFFGTYQAWYATMGSRAPGFLSGAIDNLKSTNHALKFGITLYENEIDSRNNPYIDDVHLPPAVRAKVDVIRLFLHYRVNGPNFPAYVAQAQALFPKAQIVAGVYAYDRIDYIPCAPSSKAPCTPAQEVGYFQQALNAQVQLLRQGVVTALDCFPGYFGSETTLYGSAPNSDQLACNDVARCVQTTLAMRAALQAAHAGFAALPVQTGSPPMISRSPTNTALLPGQTQLFSVTVGGTGPFTYQWFKNGAQIASATAASYHTPPVSLGDNGSTYICRVTNAYGTVDSQPGQMSVSGP